MSVRKLKSLIRMIKFWTYKKEYKKIKKKILKNVDVTISKGSIFFGKS